MIKRMNCPYCGTVLDNDALWAQVEEGFQCAKCGKDYDEDGEEITERSQHVYRYQYSSVSDYSDNSYSTSNY